jgi:hypothetical protein
MPRITEISDKFFSRTDDGKTLAEFADALVPRDANIGELGINLTVSGDFVLNGESVYQLVADRGTGRIYDGLKSLESMSRVIRGIGAGSTTMFDSNIIAYTPNDMKTASIDVAIVIVHANLGLSNIYPYAKAMGLQEVAAYDKFAATIARQVRAGGFKTEDHITEALLRVKNLVKAALNAKVVK